MAESDGALSELAETVRQLHRALLALEAECTDLPLTPLSEQDWFEVVERKLLPQLGTEAWLVVAVTGGTNIGKSVVFNHLAGFRASASSPLASGTKHPVCLIPTGFEARVNLTELFPGFTVKPWASPDDPLNLCDDDLLFWRTGAEVPRNLLLLDTPDIDSDAPVNWRRADAVRQAADVLVAVLTQQKYNDAAVKQFFRKAAAEDKAVILVFNQCELPDDEAYWPLWCRTFCEETNLKPEWIYVAPNDRQRAENLTLPFFERSMDQMESVTSPSSGLRPPSPSRGEGDDDAVSFQETLSRLRFAEIKLRTLRGALQHASGPSGVEQYLSSIRVASVHGFYNTVGQWMMTPVRSVNTWVNGPAELPWDVYRQSEWDAILRTVEKVYERLEWLTQLGHDLLKQQLEELLAGTSRAKMLEGLSRDHGQVDFANSLEQLVAQELEAFRRDNPHYFQFFQRLDIAAAAARPGLSVALGFSGLGLPLGEAATHLASHALMQSALHVVGDVAGGTMAAAVGETAISSTAASGVAFLQARFYRLQAAFTANRVAWLAERLERDLLGTTTRRLKQAVGVPQSEVYADVEKLTGRIQESLSIPQH